MTDVAIYTMSCYFVYGMYIEYVQESNIDTMHLEYIYRLIQLFVWCTSTKRHVYNTYVGSENIS